MSAALKTSGRPSWATPTALFARLDAEFHFTLDSAASAENAKCDRFYTEADDGLSKPWRGVVFCNPPYGRDLEKWIRKGWLSSTEGATVVMLVPARTDTHWWARYASLSSEIRFVHGRIRFDDGTGRATFPSVVEECR